MTGFTEGINAGVNLGQAIIKPFDDAKDRQIKREALSLDARAQALNEERNRYIVERDGLFHTAGIISSNIDNRKGKVSAEDAQAFISQRGMMAQWVASHGLDPNALNNRDDASPDNGFKVTQEKNGDFSLYRVADGKPVYLTAADGRRVTITQDEVKGIAKSTALIGKDPAAVAALNDHYDELQRKRADGYDRGLIELRDSKVIAGEQRAEKRTNAVFDKMDAATNAARDAATLKAPVGAPNPDYGKAPTQTAVDDPKRVTLATQQIAANQAVTPSNPGVEFNDSALTKAVKQEWALKKTLASTVGQAIGSFFSDVTGLGETADLKAANATLSDPSAPADLKQQARAFIDSKNPQSAPTPQPPTLPVSAEQTAAFEQQKAEKIRLADQAGRDALRASAVAGITPTAMADYAALNRSGLTSQQEITLASKQADVQAKAETDYAPSKLVDKYVASTPDKYQQQAYADATTIVGEFRQMFGVHSKDPATAWANMEPALPLIAAFDAKNGGHSPSHTAFIMATGNAGYSPERLQEMYDNIMTNSSTITKLPPESQLTLLKLATVNSAKRGISMEQSVADVLRSQNLN
jgi:hypothetical protein